MSVVTVGIIGLLFNICISVLFNIIERYCSFRKINYNARILSDLCSLSYVWILFSIAYFIEFKYLNQINSTPLAQIPILIKIVIFYLLYDFGSYWVHRLMHTPLIWSTHVWHHLPTEIWCLSGARASIWHVFFYRLAFLPFFFFLFPPTIGLIIAIEIILYNSWMHMNLKWYSWMRYLEWVIVTPRFHHLHHGSSEAFHNINYGAQFTIWDRLFHTFVSPDDVDPKTLEFGVNGGEKVSIVRAAIGI